MGAELINEPSVYADAEILALLIDSLLQAGLEQFQISVGNVEYFKGICQTAGLDAATEMELRDALSGKNYYAAEELLRSRGLDRATRDLFLKATRFVSTREELAAFLTDDMHPQARAAIERLMQLCDVMDAYGFSRYISFDLSLLSKYRYYTGIVFKGYTYGAGDAIASGVAMVLASGAFAPCAKRSMMRRSSDLDGVSTRHLNMKRSTCASGSG